MPIPFQFSTNVSESLASMVHDSMFWNSSVGVEDYPGRSGTERPPGEPEPPFDPRVSQRDPLYDSGGRQPGFGILSGDAENEGMGSGAYLRDVEPVPWFTWSLDPLRIAFNGLRLPILGLISLTLEKTRAGGLFVYSLMYMSLPTLAWFLGVDTGRYMRVPYQKWRPDPEGAVDVVRCEICGGWNPDDPFVGVEDFKRNPFLACPCTFEKRTNRPYRDAIALPEERWYVDTCMYQGFATLARTLAIETRCVHPDMGNAPIGSVSVPRPTLDGLFIHHPGEEWKANQTQGGLRCHTCNPTTLHGWQREFLDTVITAPPKTTIGYDAQYIKLLLEWNKFLTVYQRDEVVYVLGLSADRVKYLIFPGEQHIILYNQQELPALVRGLPDYRPGKTRFFRVPEFGHNRRILGNIRVLLAYFTGAPITMVLTNQSRSARDQAYIDTMVRSPYRSVSGTAGHFYPTYAGALVVRGRFGLAPLLLSLRSFHWGATVYGWDEIYPTYHQKNLAVVYRGLATPALMMGLTSYAMKGPETAIMISAEVDNDLTVSKIKWSRQAVYWVDRIAGADVDPGRLTFWHVWADPRPIVAQGTNSDVIDINKDREWLRVYGPTDKLPEVQRVVAPGDHVLQELAASLGGIAFFTMGTRGDMLPFEALARHIAKLGVPVRLYKLNDVEEGRLILDSAMGRTTDSKAVKYFNRARTVVLENMTSASVVHASLMMGDVPTLDLTPPADLITSRTVGGGWLMTLGSSLLGVWYQASARCGPYTGPRIVPTSANGRTFLKARQNRGKYDIGAVWGSDDEPAPGFESVPRVPEGDHEELFRDYKTIVCHGGAGTVSTAAASGACVVVPVGGLDRSRRNPYDAGLGLVPGADPDNIYLVLADSDIRFLAIWLRKNWMKPWKLWSFYGFPGLGWGVFRLLMLQTLYAQSFKTVPVSTEPLSVLFGVLGGRTSTWLAFSLVLLGSKVVDTLLDYLNISYMRLITQYLAYNWRMAVSPIGLFLATKFNIGVGLVYAMASPWLYRLFGQFGQAYANAFMGVAVKARPDGEEHPPVLLELSLRHWGPLPVLHTALVCPELGQRYEGVTVDRLYVLTIRKGGVQSPFVLPTTLTWEDVAAIPNYSGRYSLAWNCQTGIIIALKNRLVSLGPGGPILYATTAAVSMLYTINAVCTTLLWSIVQLMPATVDPATVRPSYIDVAGSAVTSLWNRLSTTGEWDPVGVLRWWRSLYVPF